MEKKMKINRIYIVSVILVGMVCFGGISLRGETGETGNTAVIPGDINQICSYTNFFYNYPSEDFFYQLNDRLLFTDKPDGRLLGSGFRNKLMKIVRWHNVIKRSLDRFRTKDTGKSGMITLNVADPGGYKKAGVLMNLLGLRLDTTPEGKYRVFPNPTMGVTNYFAFALIDIPTLQNQLNQTHRFHFKLKESDVPVPWDFEFLSEVTGLKIDSGSFYETMVKDERFSLFVGMLYRLSHREIDFIGGLVTAPQLGAWKEIYRDNRFLMGMFILSGALRVTGGSSEEKPQLSLPGGAAAKPFWTHLSGKDPDTAPLAFLHSLATTDDGKLNYMYLFSYFLPPKSQEVFFTGENAKKMVEFYQRSTLKDGDKIRETQFPGLSDVNVYTLLYSLRMEGDGFYFPTGLDSWLQALREKSSLFQIGMSEKALDVEKSGGILDAVKETTILLPGGKSVTGTIQSRDGSKLVVVADLPEVEKGKKNGEKSDVTFEKTGKEDEEMVVAEIDEETPGDAAEPEFKLDDIEPPDTAGAEAEKPKKTERTGEYTGTGERSFVQTLLGRLWPGGRFNVRVGRSWMQPRDGNFKAIYGDRFNFLDVKVFIRVTDRLSAWYRTGSIAGEADIPLLGQVAKSRQRFSSFGIGYTVEISKRFHLSMDAGLVTVKFREEALTEFREDSASGYRLEGGLSFHVTRWFFADVSVGYISADAAWTDGVALKLGGLGAGVGFGITF